MNSALLSKTKTKNLQKYVIPLLLLTQPYTVLRKCNADSQNNNVTKRSSFKEDGNTLVVYLIISLWVQAIVGPLMLGPRTGRFNNNKGVSHPLKGTRWGLNPATPTQ